MENSDSIIKLSFNQDNSCFSVATETGFKIYQTYPFKGPIERNMNGGIGAVEMIYKSNFLAMIGGGEAPLFNNNKVVIWDENKSRFISDLKFLTNVINIKLKKDLLFVVCEDRIYIFNLNTYDAIYTIDTGKNLKGYIAINNDPTFTVMAYPSIKGLDNVTLKHFKNKKNIIDIAQDYIISFMTINYDGTLLATSNEKGTLIKIFSCFDGNFLMLFRRGHEKVENIYLSFDNENKFMAVTSSKGTIHIFSLKSIILKLKENEKAKNEKDNCSGKNIIKNIEKNKKEELKQKEENLDDFEKEENINIFNIFNENDDKLKNNNKEKLPENSKSFLGKEKGFARFKIKPQKNICSFVRSNLLIVITYDNKYYQVEIDKTKGVCKLLKEEKI